MVEIGLACSLDCPRQVVEIGQAGNIALVQASIRVIHSVMVTGTFLFIERVEKMGKHVLRPLPVPLPVLFRKVFAGKVIQVGFFFQ